MCFKIHKSRKEPQRAEKDIKVFKLFFENNGRYHLGVKKYPLTSICQLTSYRIGALYRVKIGEKDWNNTIDEGLHSYSEQMDRYGNFLYDVVCACVIPAGSKYYFNPDTKEYVSNRLIVLKKL